MIHYIECFMNINRCGAHSQDSLRKRTHIKSVYIQIGF